ncbi:MAG: glycoside hydrolase family 31 protein, partial [Bacteroidota bacterium]|nr:glycoside hydrolase family 31 protein [Bacteroidota bacterium]
KDPHIVKDIWNFPHEYSSIITEVVNERYALVPYIYTMARKTYDTGISLCRPMYYDYPEKQEAYSFKNEYMFGDNLLVQPITAPSQNDFSDVKVWLPAGNDWYEWHTGTMLKGGQVVERKFLISEFPIYVKAGSIIPMYPKLKNLEEKVNDLIVSVFPGGNSETKLYEDAGNNIGYEKGEYSYTTIKSEKEKDGSLKVTVMPREGSFPEMLSERNYEIRLHGSVMPQSISINGTEVSYSAEQKGNAWNYTGSDLTAHIYIPQMACNQKLEVVVKYPQEQVNVDGMIGKMNRLKLSTAYLKDHWYQGAALPEIIPTAEEVNMAIEYNPENFSSLVKMFNESYPLIPDVIGKTHVGKVVIDKCVNYIK